MKGYPQNPRDGGAGAARGQLPRRLQQALESRAATLPVELVLNSSVLVMGKYNCDPAIWLNGVSLFESHELVGLGGF